MAGAGLLTIAALLLIGVPITVLVELVRGWRHWRAIPLVQKNHTRAIGVGAALVLLGGCAGVPPANYQLYPPPANYRGPAGYQLYNYSLIPPPPQPPPRAPEIPPAVIAPPAPEPEVVPPTVDREPEPPVVQRPPDPSPPPGEPRQSQRKPPGETCVTWWDPCHLWN
jgi:hypothetical protein